MAGGSQALATACDLYHRWDEDVAITAAMGLNVYRFSVSWPRIFPEGSGRMNQKGLNFYRRLIAALQERSIQRALHTAQRRPASV